MNKLLYIAASALVTIPIVLTSCEDAIDLQPKAEVNIESYFNRPEDLQLFSNYFYPHTLANHETYDTQCDDMIALPFSSLLQLGTSRTVPESGGGWSWGVLRRMNTLLEYINRCPDEEAVKKYTAVTRFFRAYFYFEKVKRFGDVPWIDHQLGSDSPELYAARDSRELILTKMIEDIDYAINNLPTKAEESSAPYRVTKGAALALKSNFCLFEGTFRKYHNISLEGHDWKYYLEQCVEASEKLMSGSYGKYRIYNTGKPNEDYLNLFNAQDANKDEYILAVKYDQALSVRHNANAFSLAASQGRPGYTRKFVCTYLMKDGSRFTDKPGWQTMLFAEEMKDRDPRLGQSIRGLGYHRKGASEILATDLSISVTGYQPIKFVTESVYNGFQCDANGLTTCDLPELRYAEVLLNYAEAKAELGSLTQIDLENSVNELRRRVNMPFMNMAAANASPDPYLTSKTTGYTNADAIGENKGIILEIRRERGIELVQEGRRWWDLMRWKCGEMMDQDFTGHYFPGPGKYDLTGDGVEDLILYAEGTQKPDATNKAKVLQIGKDVILSEGTKGYVDGACDRMRNGFNPARDYFYPIPSGDIALNPNLKQNPEW